MYNRNTYYYFTLLYYILFFKLISLIYYFVVGNSSTNRDHYAKTIKIKMRIINDYLLLIINFNWLINKKNIHFKQIN